MQLSHSTFLYIVRRSAGGIAAVAALAMLCGCAASTAQRTAAMKEEGHALGFSPQRSGIAPPIAGMLRAPAEAETLGIVIEGDGCA